MAPSDAQELLVAYIEDAHAMEQMVDKALASMIQSAPDLPEFQDMLTHHKEETQRHIRLLEQRLEAHGQSPSQVKDAGMMLASLGLGAVDKLRKDNAGKVARDGYTAEHLEIAAYQLLERVATRCGDEETAEVARRNRADEEAMAKKIDDSWDLALDVSFREEGLQAAPPFKSESNVGAGPAEPGEVH